MQNCAVLLKYKDIKDNDTYDVIENDVNIKELMNCNYKAEYRDSYLFDKHVMDRNANIKSYIDAKKDAEKRREGGEKPKFQQEQWMCRSSIGEKTKAIGKIVDYQVTLRVPGKKEYNETKGKIDLLSLKGKIAYIIEAKMPKSTESPIRPILEVFTYWRQMGGIRKNDIKKNDVIKKFIAKSTAKGANVIRKAILIYKSNDEKSTYQKFINDTRYKNLLNILGIECYCYQIKNYKGVELINYNSIEPVYK